MACRRSGHLSNEQRPPRNFRLRCFDTPNEGTSARRLVAYAKGCSESDERSAWRAVHHAVADGDDFTIVVLLNEIERALESAEKEIVIVVGTQHIETMSDVGYDVRRAH